MTAPEPTLRELAAAATPGPWWAELHGEVITEDGSTVLDYASRNDAAFIAAANPAAILALLDRAEAAEAVFAAVERIVAERVREAEQRGAVQALYATHAQINAEASTVGEALNIILTRARADRLAGDQ